MNLIIMPTAQNYTEYETVFPYIIHSADYIFPLVLSDQRGYFEKSENYYRFRFIF